MRKQYLQLQSFLFGCHNYHADRDGRAVVTEKKQQPDQIKSFKNVLLKVFVLYEQFAYEN